MYNTSLPAASHSYYYYEPAVLNRIVKLLHETGLQISFHITGDKGIDEALDALEAAGAGVASRRHRIEHAFFIKPSSLQRMKDLGVVISTQPQLISGFGEGYRNSTDEATMANFLPLKTLLYQGIPLAFGCDVPASPWYHPKWSLIGATTRRTSSGYQPNPEQCLDMHQALRVHTMGSAYAAFEEDLKGSIEVGKLADLVVWNDDLYALSSPQQAANLEAVMVIVGGEIVVPKPVYRAFLPYASR
jgi:predicted amidohydrolase YtcJ